MDAKKGINSEYSWWLVPVQKSIKVDLLTVWGHQRDCGIRREDRLQTAVPPKPLAQNLILGTLIFLNLRQFCSSLASMQSLLSSHLFLLWTHSPDFLHLNSSARHWQCDSSEPSTHSLSPSQKRFWLMHSPLSHRRLPETHV